jgi:hypothetical protein
MKAITDYEPSIMLIITLLAGVLIRLILFNEISVSWDAGKYVYDSLLITWGQTPMVDYPTRSPAFHALLAGPLQLPGSRIITIRLLMIAITVALALGVYSFGKRIHSQKAGEASAAILLLSPLSFTYGLTVKTQFAAATVALAGYLILVVSGDDSSYPYPNTAIFLAGFMVGAGFLIRQIVLAYILALIAYFPLAHSLKLYAGDSAENDRYESLFISRETVSLQIVSSILPIVGFFVAIASGYLLLAEFDLETASSIFYQHFAGLFLSGGHGGFVWANVDILSIEGTTRKGTNRVGNFLQTLLWASVVSLPAALSLLPLARSAAETVYPDIGSAGLHLEVVRYS